MGDTPGELDLMAYADGELDAAATQRVRGYVAGDPAAAAKVRLHQQLRSASQRVCQGGLEVPAKLIHQLQILAEKLPAEPQPAVSQPQYDDRGYPLDGNGSRNHQPDSFPLPQVQTRPRFRIGYRFAAAAVLLIGLGTFLFLFFRDTSIPVVQGDNIIPVGWVGSTGRRHVDCSHHPDHFHNGFPRTLQELPASLHDFLGHDATVPDLTKLGYQFAGAGPCQIPGGKTAHLLYRPISGGSVSLFTVSLFLQPDTGQLKLDAEKVYLAHDNIDHTPMIIWRKNGVVYYLVAEETSQLRFAAQQMGLKVRI